MSTGGQEVIEIGYLRQNYLRQVIDCISAIGV